MSRHIDRRQFVALAVAASAAPAAWAQAWPAKPLRIIVPAPPGNTSDAAVRLMAKKMSEALGQPVVVENRAGGSGTIGTSAGLRAAPDGYTVTMISSTAVAAVHLIKQVPYTIDDIVPVGSYFSVPSVLVGAKAFEPNTFAEVMAWAKARPEGLSIAHSNATGAVTTASLKRIANANLTAIAYKGAPQAITDVMGGQVPVMVNDIAVTLPHIRSGAVKPYAVTSAKRSSVLPDVPTLSELLPQPVEFFGWLGFGVPKGTPQPVVAKLNGVISDAVRSEEVSAFLRNLGAEPMIQTPEQMAAYIRVEEPRWGKALKAAGIEPQ